jgi:hypothetical protein
MAPAWLLAVTLSAAPVNPDLQSAERAYAEGSYQRIQPLLHRVWQQALSDADVHRALELEALTRAAFDNAEGAIEAFQYLLALDSQYLPDSQASPKLLGFFAEARRRGALGVLSKPAPILETKPPWLEPPPGLPAAPESTPVYKRWWFWVGAAVVAGAAGTGAWLELRPIVPSGSLGQRTMQ